MSTSKKDDKEELPPLVSGIPPWHAFAFVTTLLAVAIPFLPTLEELDTLSEVSVWTTRKFPDLLSLRSLALCRLTMAGIALSLTVYLALGPGWQVYPNYKPKSKLRRVFIPLKGIGTLCPFTSWCWLVLGLGFLCRGMVALAAATVEAAGEEGPIPEWTTSILTNKILLRLTLVLWEFTGPFAILVSAVIKYVIYPEVVKGGKPHNLDGFRNQLQHNANSIFSLMEVTIMGGIPVEFSHLSMATIFGIGYISFTWIMARLYFGNAEVGPQYIYWFMDTTLEDTTTKALAALVLALTLFFAIFSVVVGTVLGGSGGGEASSPSLALNVAFLLVGSKFVCKFTRD